VIQEAYVNGVSTRSVDGLAEALGLKGISNDQVSRICRELDAQVHAFRTDPWMPSTPAPVPFHHRRHLMDPLRRGRSLQDPRPKFRPIFVFEPS
jgi:Transposase, Mutator family